MGIIRIARRRGWLKAVLGLALVATVWDVQRSVAAMQTFSRGRVSFTITNLRTGGPFSDGPFLGDIDPTPGVENQASLRVANTGEGPLNVYLSAVVDGDGDVQASVQRLGSQMAYAGPLVGLDGVLIGRVASGAIADVAVVLSVPADAPTAVALPQSVSFRAQIEAAP